MFTKRTHQVRSLVNRERLALGDKPGAGNRFRPGATNRKRTAAAFSCALAIAVAGLATFAADLRKVLAFGEESAARYWQQERARQRGQSARGFFQPSSIQPFGGRSEKLAEAKTENRKSKRKDARKGSEYFASAGSKSVCVRLCDGFHFPVGNAPGSGNLAAHEAICSGLCPGAPTRLYVIPGGTDDIGKAYSARGRQKYSALPVALRHAGTRDKTCSCRRSDEPYSNTVSLLRDFTLRKGDAVMTQSGFQVFQGAKKWPFKSRNFASLRRSKLTKGDRSTLLSLERASLNGTTAAVRRPVGRKSASTAKTVESPDPALGPFRVERKPKQDRATSRPAKTAQAVPSIAATK